MVDAIVLRSGYWYRNIQMPFDDKIHMQERSRPNPLPQNFSNGSAQYDWVIEIGVLLCHLSPFCQLLVLF